MKKAFTLNIEDDTKIVGLQIAVVVQRGSNDKKGVTFLSLSNDDIRENDEWLFKFNEKAERIVRDKKG